MAKKTSQEDIDLLEKRKWELESFICWLNNQYTFLSGEVKRLQPIYDNMKNKIDETNLYVSTEVQKINEYVVSERKNVDSYVKDKLYNIKEEREIFETYKNIEKDKLSMLKTETDKLISTNSDILAGISSTKANNEAVLKKINEENYVLSKNNEELNIKQEEINKKLSIIEKTKKEVEEKENKMGMEQKVIEDKKEEILKANDMVNKTRTQLDIDIKEFDKHVNLVNFDIEMQKKDIEDTKENISKRESNILEKEEQMIKKEKNLKDKENALNGKEKDIEYARAEIVKYEREQKFKFLTQ